MIENYYSKHLHWLPDFWSEFAIREVNMDEMIEQVAPTNVSLDDLEDLINSLSPDEVAELAECDPDVSLDDGQECFLYQDY